MLHYVWTCLAAFSISAAPPSSQESEPITIDALTLALESLRSRCAGLEFVLASEFFDTRRPEDNSPIETAHRWLRLFYREQGVMFKLRQQEGESEGELELDNQWSFDEKYVYHFSAFDWSGYIEASESVEYPSIVNPYFAACQMPRPHTRVLGRTWLDILTFREQATLSTLNSGLLRVEVADYGEWLLDPSRGFAPIVIDRRSTGLVATTINDLFVEVEPGVYLPTLVKHIQERADRTLESEMRVSSLRVSSGEWPAADFQIAFPPGTALPPGS